MSCGAGNASLTVGITDRDADDTHTATIAWGDGSSETVDPASASFTRSHTYAAAGRYTATVTVTDSHGHVTTTTADVVVEYTATGLLPPFKNGQLSAKAGSTVPVKVGLHRLRRLGAHRPGADRDRGAGRHDGAHRHRRPSSPAPGSTT